MSIKKFFSLILLAFVAVAGTAQTPEAILQSLEKYPNHALATGSTYPSIPLGEIATAPEGFEPFYFSLVGRHGSRYERSDNRFDKICSIFHKADSLGILTPKGKLLKSHLDEILDAQKGRDGELTALGYNQWLGIGQRAAKNFGAIFNRGSVDAKSSTSLRCVLSMTAFNQSLKGYNPNLYIFQDASKKDLWFIRPLADNPNNPKEMDVIHEAYNKSINWSAERSKWAKGLDFSSFLSKITTNKELLLKKCGGKYQHRIARYTFNTLLFGENFEKGNRELLSQLFTPEELRNIYVYNTSHWLYNVVGRGNEVVEMKASFMRPLIEDILDRANEAIDGKNPNVANLRFTHDSYVAPLLSVMGYDGCTPQFNQDLEVATTSFNFGTVVPMAANLQIILYRNKEGKIFVRSLVNERDAYLPIKCATAPFYPWSDFCKHIQKNMKELDKSQQRVFKKYRY